MKKSDSEFSHIQTVGQNNAAGEQEMVNQTIFAALIYHSQLVPPLRGERSRLDKVITGWLSGKETLMNPDKACRLLFDEKLACGKTF
ncbi:hypothetical protein NQZ68_014405 [Dissostichus eleginoides]|nr:hypothetical protein NQZ68_014405 [Dissostichus eleginoides]